MLNSNLLQRLHPQRNERGFTLLELLIVVIVIGILAAIALPIFLNQQRAAIDAGVKSDVRNTVGQVQGWVALNRGKSATDVDAYVAAPNNGVLTKSKDSTVLGVQVDADGVYRVCGFNPGGNDYKVAESSWSFTSATGKFTQQPGGASGQCAGAVDAAGNNVSTTPVSPAWVTNGALADGEQGAQYTAQLVASGNPAPTYALKSDSVLPGGLALSADGKLSGSPSASGTFKFTVLAKNFKASAEREFTLTLDKGHTTPAWSTAVSLPSGTQDALYSTTLSADAYPAATYELQTGSTLPAGLNLNKTTGVLAGTPTVAGDNIFTVLAKNSKGETPRTFFLNFSPSTTPPAWATTDSTLPDGQATVGYTAYTVSATGKPAPTFSSADLTSKTGLAISAAGEISGTPGASSVGTKTVTLTATNSNSAVDKQFTIVIKPKPVMLGTVTITNSSLPDGFLNTAYPGAQITSTDTGDAGTTTYSATGLPAGLSMSAGGAISGTPTAAGTASVVVTATKTVGVNGSVTDTKTLPLSVKTGFTLDGANASGWTNVTGPNAAQGGGSFTNVTSPTYAGSYAYALTTTSQAFNKEYSLTGKLTAGKSYTLQAAVRRISASGYAGVRVFNSSNGSKGGVTGDTTGTWVVSTLTFTYEAGDKLVVTAPVSGGAYYDEISVIEN